MSKQALLERFRATRKLSDDLCTPLAPEDFRIQTMPDVSPPWWNLGHTSWFFAKNLLEPMAGFEMDPGLEFVLNSYYEVHGERLERARRGSVTRPTTDEVRDFRARVTEGMVDLIESRYDSDSDRLDFLTTTGIHHEQQHQELLVTELKHILGSNPLPLRRAYVVSAAADREQRAPAARWLPFEGGLEEVGNLEGGWCWDNELPVHKVWLDPFEFSNRPVTVGEYLEFIEDGGYERPLLWLANGWSAVQSGLWTAPLYWERRDGEWLLWTLQGMRPLAPDEPVCHVSFYEADAFATWKGQSDRAYRGSRLPTESEWELAVRRQGFREEEANLLSSGLLHPAVARSGAEGELLQSAGDVWEWTSSHYEPYPGYQTFDGALTEYNGKFMDNQRVLRGGSCATPTHHLRVSYRNFWPAETRFQFSGFRLCRSADTEQERILE